MLLRGSQVTGGKIGVLGLNGSGKSSLLRIMAGEDTDIVGEARPMPGIKIGYLPKEPRLDEAKTVREAVEEGLSEPLEAQRELEKIYAAYAEADADFDALAKKQENAANWIDRDTEVKCYLPGVPRATYMPYPLRIFQRERDIMIAYEYANAVRDIYMEDVGEAPVDSWMGQSVGHWEGDTLVVKVTGLNDQTWFDRAGNFASNSLRVTERYTPINASALMYEATIEDPNVFTRPWTIRMPLYRRLEENVQVLEYKCVEFAEEILYGHLRSQPSN